MTLGLAVLVQEVMDAMATEPSPIFSLEGALCFSYPSAFRVLANSVFMFLRRILSWGRLWPAVQGSTSARSSSRMSVYSGMFSGSYQRVCSFS